MADIRQTYSFSGVRSAEAEVVKLNMESQQPIREMKGPSKCDYGHARPPTLLNVAMKT